jgi:hypothetical protein
MPGSDGMNGQDRTDPPRRTGNLKPLDGKRPSTGTLRSAWKEWADEEIANWASITFVTLNLKAKVATASGGVLPLDVQTTRNQVKKFGNLVDRAVYGNLVQRFNKRVRRIAVLEHGADRGWHCHLAMEKPPGMVDVTFVRLLRDAWSKSEWSSKRPDIRSGDLSLPGYVLKHRSKSEFENWSDTIILEATVAEVK